MTPEEDDELLVHADELILRGDPLGELIVVAHQMTRAPTPESRRREAELLAIQRRRLDSLFGGVPAYVWRLGLVDRIELDHLGSKPFDALPKLAREFSTRRVRALRLRAWQRGNHDIEPIFAELAALRLSHLREIEVSDRVDTEGMPMRIGNLAPLYAAYPQLEVLALAGRAPLLGSIGLPAVRRLAFADLRGDDVRRIVAAHAPVLADLSLAFEQTESITNVAATFGPLLHRELPALVALRLQPPVAALGYIAGELATCPFARHLRRLALVGPLAGDAIEALVAAAPALQRLEHFELAGSGLSAGNQKRLRRLYGRALDVR